VEIFLMVIFFSAKINTVEFKNHFENI